MGFDHLPAANVEEDATFLRKGPRAYGRALIEELKGWNKIKPIGEDKDRSESGGSDSIANTTDSLRSAELSGVFRFSSSDTILIVDDSEFNYLSNV